RSGRRHGVGVRDRFLRALVLFGVAVVVITEGLSAFHAIHRLPLAVCWLLVVAQAFLPVFRRRYLFERPPFDPIVAGFIAGIATILTLTAITAGFSPPNSADAMAY